nr:hypothetical protein [Nanoarchaeum sp.]
NEFKFGYDSLGRKINIIDPDLGTWNYSYDANNNLIQQEDNNENTIYLGYDSLNRLTSKNSSTTTINYHYDLGLNGTISKVNSSNYETNYTYDNRLRKTTENKKIGNNTFSSSFGYDDLNRIIWQNLNGYITNYSYNAQGMETISGVLDNIDYTAFNGVLARNYTNGLDSSFEYENLRNRLEMISTNNLQNLEYEYDDVGNVLSINDSINENYKEMNYDGLNRLVSADSNDYDINYYYDSIGRIINVITNEENVTYNYNNPVHSPTSITSGNILKVGNLRLLDTNGTLQTYGFDISSSNNISNVSWKLVLETGNISSNIILNLTLNETIPVYVDNTTNSTTAYVIVNNGSLTDIDELFGLKDITGSYSYDPNGNLISDPDYQYVYNSFNNLVQVKSLTGSLISSYTYDQDGNRIMKNVSGEVTYYPIDGLVRVSNSSGNYDTVYYYHNNVLVAENETWLNKLKFFHPDHLGSTTLVTNSSGDKVENTDYYPFGAEITESNERFTYTGKEKDEESDLQYYGARYYNSNVGLFTQPDLIIPDVYNPQSLNHYAYVLNNPYKYVDEGGNFPGDFQKKLSGYTLTKFTGIPGYVYQGLAQMGRGLYNQYKTSTVATVTDITLKTSGVSDIWDIAEGIGKEIVYQGQSENVPIVSDFEISQTRENFVSSSVSFGLKTIGSETSSQFVSDLSHADSALNVVCDTSVTKFVINRGQDLESFIDKLSNKLSTKIKNSFVSKIYHKNYKDKYNKRKNNDK